jgi:hypothetical protein
MRVLVLCEESQAVCKAFRERGHEAYSCDLMPCSGGHPEWHIQNDALYILGLRGGDLFDTLDGKEHVAPDRWDLIVAHPPCTYLSNAGACRLYPKKGHLNKKRYKLGLMAKEFFLQIYNADCGKICVENPIPTTIFDMPPCSQIIEPYEFGHPYSKKTCLWLKGLPKLKPTKIVTKYKPYVSCGTSHNKGNKEKSGYSRAGGAAKVRSRTFDGIARAMADQWGSLNTTDSWWAGDDPDQVSIYNLPDVRMWED